ncbi:MAG: hypothetical protein IPM02_16250 [Betaproteobacteria bacterium]|nr:hypothetical protein [Betaproteobacteria bacterium]
MPSIRRRFSVLLLQALICCMAVPAVHAQKALAATEALDIDANNATDALTDGLLVIRYLFGLRLPALVQGAVGPGPGRTNQQIEDYLAASSSVATPVLDIDDNGARDALTDGLLVLRYLFGMRGAPLIAGAVGGGAQRDTIMEIEGYLATLTAATPQAPAGCTVVASPPATLAAPVTPGTPVQLTASCAAGQQPITYTWDAGAFTGSVRNVAPMTTTTYSMVASNGAGAAPAVNVTVNVSAPTSYCQPGDHIIDQPWPVSGQTRPGTNGFTNQVYSFRLTVPFTFNPPLNINNLGFIHVAESAGSPVTFRVLTVSTAACDFPAARRILV